MLVIEQFKSKCKTLRAKYLDINGLLSILKEQYIIHTLSQSLGFTVAKGTNKVDLDWVEEIYVESEIVQFINRNKQKYKSYVAYVKKEYSTIGLGIIYKKEVVSPHMDFAVDNIIEKYSEQELAEISDLIDEYLIYIDKDIEYLQNNSELDKHEFYFRNYESGGFEGDELYTTLNDVIANYKYIK
jgi:hypothetical protein